MALSKEMELASDSSEIPSDLVPPLPRFSRFGLSRLSDQDLLELTLSHSMDENKIEHASTDLLRKFGSYAGVLTASRSLLEEIDGVSSDVTVDLAILREASVRLAQTQIRTGNVLENWASLLQYARCDLAHRRTERLRCIFLDGSGALLSDDIIAEGTVNGVLIQARSIFARALKLDATGIVLVHNHPSGDPAPSIADISNTRIVKGVAGELGIVLHDHIIVGSSGDFSMKKDGLI